MEKREVKFYMEVGVEAVSKDPPLKKWGIVWGVEENKKVIVEVEMEYPNIDLCLVAGYLKDKNEADGRRKLRVIFHGKIRSIFVNQIRRIILR